MKLKQEKVKIFRGNAIQTVFFLKYFLVDELPNAKQKKLARIMSNRIRKLGPKTRARGLKL